MASAPDQAAVEAFSAGTDPQPVNPMAVESMQERGVDISGHRAKSVREFLGQRFDFVITVCDRAQARCPTFPDSPRLLPWSVPDPAKAGGRLKKSRPCFVLSAIRSVAGLKHSFVKNWGRVYATKHSPDVKLIANDENGHSFVGRLSIIPKKYQGGHPEPQAKDLVVEAFS